MSSSHGPGVRGRPFSKGNAGRKQGSKNKSTLISAALLEDERPELLRIAIDIAKRGNVAMLKFLLARLLPRERPFRIDLPDIASARDAVQALRHILRSVSEGAITPAEGAALAALVGRFLSSADEKNSSPNDTPTLLDHLRSADQE